MCSMKLSCSLAGRKEREKNNLGWCEDAVLQPVTLLCHTDIPSIHVLNLLYTFSVTNAEPKDTDLAG